MLPETFSMALFYKLNDPYLRNYRETRRSVREKRNREASDAKVQKLKQAAREAKKRTISEREECERDQSDITQTVRPAAMFTFYSFIRQLYHITLTFRGQHCHQIQLLPNKHLRDLNRIADHCVPELQERIWMTSLPQV